ncbi:hypothetical protein IC575_016886 [Cucumis melo]
MRRRYIYAYHLFLDPRPSTLHPQPSTLNPPPSTLPSNVIRNTHFTLIAFAISFSISTTASPIPLSRHGHRPLSFPTPFLYSSHRKAPPSP